MAGSLSGIRVIDTPTHCGKVIDFSRTQEGEIVYADR